MPKFNPNQYECDNLDYGDKIIIIKRGIIYKFLRKFLFKEKLNKLKLKDPQNIDRVIEAYQEDCMIVYEYESKAMQLCKNVPYDLRKSREYSPFYKSNNLNIMVDIYNIQISFKHLTITIPTNILQRAIKDNEKIIKECDDKKLLADLMQFTRYKGDYFKNKVIKDNIKCWSPMVCSICREPVLFEFRDNDVKIINKCTCGVTKSIDKFNTYDDFALWYHSQAKDIKNEYDKFWIKGEN